MKPLIKEKREGLTGMDYPSLHKNVYMYLKKFRKNWPLLKIFKDIKEKREIMALFHITTKEKNMLTKSAMTYFFSLHHFVMQRTKKRSKEKRERFAFAF